MTIGSGVAIAGIWIAIAIIGWHEPGAGAFTAIMGMIATVHIAKR